VPLAWCALADPVPAGRRSVRGSVLETPNGRVASTLIAAVAALGLVPLQLEVARRHWHRQRWATVGARAT
jgi:hypothetical protein